MRQILSELVTVRRITESDTSLSDPLSTGQLEGVTIENHLLLQTLYARTRGVLAPIVQMSSDGSKIVFETGRPLGLACGDVKHNRCFSIYWAFHKALGHLLRRRGCYHT